MISVRLWFEALPQVGRRAAVFVDNFRQHHHTERLNIGRGSLGGVCGADPATLNRKISDISALTNVFLSRRWY
jgi:hypothetical protein